MAPLDRQVTVLVGDHMFQIPVRMSIQVSRVEIYVTLPPVRSGSIERSCPDVVGNVQPADIDAQSPADLLDPVTYAQLKLWGDLKDAQSLYTVRVSPSSEANSQAVTSPSWRRLLLKRTTVVL